MKPRSGGAGAALRRGRDCPAGLQTPSPHNPKLPRTRRYGRRTAAVWHLQAQTALSVHARSVASPRRAAAARNGQTVRPPVRQRQLAACWAPWRMWSRLASMSTTAQPGSSSPGEEFSRPSILGPSRNWCFVPLPASTLVALRCALAYATPCRKRATSRTSSRRSSPTRRCRSPSAMSTRGVPSMASEMEEGRGLYYLGR